MLFQSWEYFLLLCVTILIIRISPNNTLRKAVILFNSLLFYAYGGGWQILLFGAIIISAYINGILLSKTKNRLLFSAMLLILFSPLFIYKYIPFLLIEFCGTAAEGITGNLILPIGISFYTFQAVGYVIDVYRGQTVAERDLLTFSCFISFFPQLVAGPIERSGNLIHQIEQFTNPTEEDYSIGFRHILLGLTLKLLIAETMAELVDPVYNNLNGKGGLAVLIATFCFGIQIYCDFNGYTQIAIGSAKIMGIDLMQNFNHPYRAGTVTDFWRRWHISLTSWFRDYVYFPLGGSRCSKRKMLRNTIIVFLLSGIWHGANWTFALWGLFNGIAMATEKLINPHKKVHGFFNWLVTYIIINLFWVLFRANSLRDAGLAYYLIFTDTLPQLLSLNSMSAIMNFLLRENGWSNSVLLPLIASAGVYLIYEYGYLIRMELTELLHSSNNKVRWIIYMILIMITLYLGKTLQQSAFVYFRF